MFLVLSAGSGGGWAVNSFFPKENGIISQDSASLISIYGHELAHTLAGPVNEKGQAAGDVPFGNQGEAHAGWFQGKVEALYNEELRQHANKKCEDFFRSSEFDKLDLKDIQMTESMPSNFLTGQAGINFGISGNVWTTHMEILGMPGGNISSIPVGKTIRCDF